ncbi:MAG: tetratricopeptide repeat protein [Bryobacteraceae bacterium]
MKRTWWALPAVALACSLSCAHRNAGVRRPHPAREPATAVAAAMNRQSRNAVDAGEGDLSVRQLRERLVREPGNLEVRLALARYFRAAGAPELALEHARLAGERSPGDAQAALLEAQLLHELNEGRQGVDRLEAFLGSHPQSQSELPSWLGILLDNLKEYPRAEKAHRQALALAPQLDSLHNNLGYNLLLQGRKTEAAEEFRMALSLSPYSEIARNNLGLALVDKPREAITLWQSVSDPATAHSNMAALLIEQGQYAEARKEIDLALGYNRKHSAALRNLELVSRLDGKPAVIPVTPVRGHWTWLKSTVRWVIGS